MFSEVRKAVASKVEVAFASGGFLLSLSGASLAAAFGRIPLAVLLAALALGIGFRLVGRRRSANSTPGVAGWVRAVSLALSVVEIAALVEATDTAVRYHQEAFSYAHWAFVLVALGLAYVVQCRLIAALSRLIFRPAP